MLFTEEDEIVMKHCRQDKNSKVKRLLNEFANKNWTNQGWRKLLNKTDATGIVERTGGSERPKTSTIVQHTEAVEELVLRQGN